MPLAQAGSVSWAELSGAIISLAPQAGKPEVILNTHSSERFPSQPPRPVDPSPLMLLSYLFLSSYPSIGEVFPGHPFPNHTSWQCGLCVNP